MAIELTLVPVNGTELKTHGNGRMVAGRICRQRWSIDEGLVDWTTEHVRETTSSGPPNGGRLTAIEDLVAEADTERTLVDSWSWTSSRTDGMDGCWPQLFDSLDLCEQWD